MSSRSVIPGSLTNEDFFAAPDLNDLPGGALSRWTRSTDYTFTTGVDDIMTTGVFTAPGGRLYGIHVHAGRFDTLHGSVVGGGSTLVKFGVRDYSANWLGTVINQRCSVEAVGGDDVRYDSLDGWIWHVPAAGPCQYRFSMSSEVDSAIRVVATTDDPGRIMLHVVDFGPSF